MKLKEFLERIYEFIFRKNSLTIGIIVLLYILFKEPIESLLTQTIVEYALYTIKSIWYNDLIFFLIILLLIGFSILKYNKYSPSRNLSSFIITISVIYLLHRIFGDTWIFTSLYWCSSLKYADIILVVVALQLILLLRKTSKSHTNVENSFYNDAPIHTDENDKLGFNSYAESVANKILLSHFKNSFALGVNGNWGSGKTSFIKLLKKHFQKESIIEIDFNAWNSISPKAIIQDFFENVHESIRQYHSSLSRLIIQYSNKLVALDSNTISQSIQSAVSAITGYNSLNSLYNDINNAIAKINKKIIVYIDDLDRLDKDEIIEVFKIIRNTANFQNTFFIVAYDRKYILNALDAHNTHNKEEFLEKIFQLEINLPIFNKKVLRRELARKLKLKLPKRIHSIIENDVIGTPLNYYQLQYLNEWLNNMRDVNRLANSLILNLSMLIGEVVFHEYLRMEILRIKHPAVYELLQAKSSDFLIKTSVISRNSFIYKLKTIENKDKNESNLHFFEQKGDSYLEEYLFDNHKELFIPRTSIKKIVSFIDEIFKDNFYFKSPSISDSHLSIIHPSKFNRYFNSALLDGDLSEVEFSNTKEQSQEVFNSKISEWVKNGFEKELESRFIDLKTFDNRDDFEKVIKGIFHLANQPSQKQSENLKSIVGYDVQDLAKKLSNYKNKLVEDYYPEENDESNLKNFLKRIFFQAKSPYIFEALLLDHLSTYSTNDFPLSKEECKEISIMFLKNYSEKTYNLDSNIWHLYHHSAQTDRIPVSNYSVSEKRYIPEEAKEILKDFVSNKDLDGFLFEIINTKPFNENLFEVSRIAFELFGSWQNFRKQLENWGKKESKYIEEFKKFFTEFAKENYQKFIEFSFDVIPVQEKFRKLN